MENKFKIKVECIFNPLNLDIIKKQSNTGKLDNFFKTKKMFKTYKFRKIYLSKNQIVILKAINLLKDDFNLRLLIFGRGLERKI